MLIVLTTLAAAFLTQASFILWKLAVGRLPIIGGAPFGATLCAFLSSALWWMGVVAAACGWLLLVKAVEFGEISIVQPLMSVGDLLLVAVAVFFFKERLSVVEWLGLALTLAGAVILGSQAREVKPTGIDWTRLGLLLGSIMAVGIPVVMCSRRMKTLELPLACGVGAAFGIGALFTKLMTAYPSFGGANVGLWPSLLNPVLPVVLLANIAGLVLLQVALQRGRAVVVVPVQLALINGLVAVGGWGVFGEPLLPVRLLGMGAVVVGAILLGRVKTSAEVHSVRKDEMKARVVSAA